MDGRRAVVIGAGIGGLTAARGLVDGGWQVTVFERADGLRPVGAGLAVAPNALRGLDAIGVGADVRALSALGMGGVCRPDGRWMIRIDAAELQRRFGETAAVVRRSALVDLLAGGLPSGAVRASAQVTEVEPGDERRPALVRATVSGAATEIEADLVVAADGIDSRTRAALFPDLPGPVYSGHTVWRILTPPLGSGLSSTETWGRGAVVGVMPLADGGVYLYFAVPAPPGQRAADERAELVRRFGGWHAPIPKALDAVDPDDVLRNDIYWLATPPPAFHRGRVALVGDAAHAMTPYLGQGGCQAIEDAVTLARFLAADQVPAALARYTDARLPRTSRIARQSARVGSVVQTRSHVVRALRDTALAAVGRFAPQLFYGSLESALEWRPPAPDGRAGRLR
ncbi:FAD-dependent monooxygenase [Allonocardiopsis opalescens]|nr:FAD-dependent monooxygenase [Allonocardiopsis opalescens]